MTNLELLAAWEARIDRGCDSKSAALIDALLIRVAAIQGARRNGA